MRKLIILKSLIDFIWIVTCIPMIALLLFFSVFMFINPESLKAIFDFEVDGNLITAQFFAFLLIITCFFGIYCVYLFRKTLRYFQRVKPFHIDVIKNFYKIGYLLSIIGIGGTILFFTARLVLKSELKINLGMSPYVMLICLGLFFMVLSEVFKVAKQAKEENDLTV
ncbi:DUF2975 domain-containing protein [Winogradskyella sp.]|nr:DUF2975 domain-containing protein [Winogradskyella sp.]MDC0006429.1 DUF2975 domain-containing protein [Winogradskyella sp.]